MGGIGKSKHVTSPSFLLPKSKEVLLQKLDQKGPSSRTVTSFYQSEQSHEAQQIREPD